MTQLYMKHPVTGEYLGSRQLMQRDENPRYNPDTHDPADQYIFNPRTGSLTQPMPAGENQIQKGRVSGDWELVDDYRGHVFWDTATKKQNTITELGIAPDPEWTDREPTEIQVWDGSAWADDVDLWLDRVVRPQRDAKMNVFEWRYARHARDLRQGNTPVDAIADLDAYMQALADLPETLTAIQDPIPWPQAP